MISRKNLPNGKKFSKIPSFTASLTCTSINSVT
jgi:hypothetical protein